MGWRRFAWAHPWPPGRTQRSCIARQAGYRGEELLPEIVEGAKHNSVPDPPHGVKVKPLIVQRVKGARDHLASHVQVPQIRSGMMPARVASTSRIEGSIVFHIARVLDIDAPLAREELAVARVAGRHYA